MWKCMYCNEEGIKSIDQKDFFFTCVLLYAKLFFFWKLLHQKLRLILFTYFFLVDAIAIDICPMKGLMEGKRIYVFKVKPMHLIYWTNLLPQVKNELNAFKQRLKQQVYFFDNFSYVKFVDSLELLFNTNVLKY